MISRRRGCAFAFNSPSPNKWFVARCYGEWSERPQGFYLFQRDFKFLLHWQNRVGLALNPAFSASQPQLPGPEAFPLSVRSALSLASCNSVVRSVSNRQTNLSWHFGPVLVSAAWICQHGPSRCLEHHDALYSDTSAIWGEKGSTSEGIVFQHSWKVMECNSFRNVHLWVYNKRVSVCVFSPLTFRSKVP